MIRVLHIFHRMDNGGIENFVMNNYRIIDRTQIQFDFLTDVNDPGYFDDEILAMGGKLLKAYPIKKNPLKHFLSIKRIVNENKYNIVHRHTGSAFGYLDLRAAKKGGTRGLIIHSHNPMAEHPMLHYISKFLFKTPTINLACSKKAGEWLYGKNVPFLVIPNGINCSKFKFGAKIRENYRKELGLDGFKVIGNIGKIKEQKNHVFLMKIFKELHDLDPSFKLVCVGSGYLMEKIKQLAVDLKINDDVLFMGDRSDVNLLLNAFDMILMPSLYEGLPVTLIESQANGMPSVVSSEAVPSEANLIDKMDFISLNKTAKEWAEYIVNKDLQRVEHSEEAVAAAGYDLGYSADYLTKLYKSLN